MKPDSGDADIDPDGRTISQQTTQSGLRLSAPTRRAAVNVVLFLETAQGGIMPCRICLAMIDEVIRRAKVCAASVEELVKVVGQFDPTSGEQMGVEDRAVD